MQQLAGDRGDRIGIIDGLRQAVATRDLGEIGEFDLDRDGPALLAVALHARGNFRGNCFQPRRRGRPRAPPRAIRTSAAARWHHARSPSTPVRRRSAG